MDVEDRQERSKILDNIDQACSLDYLDNLKGIYLRTREISREEADFVIDYIDRRIRNIRR